MTHDDHVTKLVFQVAGGDTHERTARPQRCGYA